MRKGAGKFAAERSEAEVKRKSGSHVQGPRSRMRWWYMDRVVRQQVVTAHQAAEKVANSRDTGSHRADLANAAGCFGPVPGATLGACLKPFPSFRRVGK